MKSLRGILSRVSSLPGFRFSYLPAATALIAIVLTVVLAEARLRDRYEQQLRAQVFAQASLIRAKLEGNLSGGIQLVRGFVATLETEPDMTQERFAQLVSNLLAEKSQIRHIAAAPDLVVRLVYPMEGNERALGLNYYRAEDQRAAALRARDTGDMILAGPVDLVQGGKAFIARFPVFVHENGAPSRFWGIVSAVIDADRLYADSGLLDPNLPIQIALVGKDATGGNGVAFYGPREILDESPVTVDVLLPSGSWQVAAVPTGGWNAEPPELWKLRLFMLFTAALILIPTLISGRLFEDRRRYIMQLHERERELERLSRRLGLALQTSRVGVWEMNIENNDLVWDDRMNELYGYSPDDGKRDYTSWADRLHPDDLERAEAEFNQAVTTRGEYLSEYRLLLDGGEVRHIRAIGAVCQEEGEAPRILGVNWDVSADIALNEDLKHANMLSEARNAELEIAKARIEFNALHDSLTGLPNRRYLDEVLNEHAEKFARGEEHAALLHIDLDRFKQINDTLGHATGDAMLVHAAQVLKATVGKDDFVARIGGDEFVVLLRGPVGGKQTEGVALARLAGALIDRMKEPVVHDGHECRFGGSIGIAGDTHALADPRRLLINADIALYRAKAHGRNRYQFFNDALQAEIVTTKRVADEILSGIENNEFIPYYQPQFDARTREIIGVEALARWKHPDGSIQPPARFMKIAEELNVVATLDRIILEQTLRDMEGWEAEGLHIPKASVNVSVRRLHDEELIRSLCELGIRPGTISFELVESIFLDEHDEVVAWNVDQIKELGIDVEIDDFGTGHASIVSLLKLKPSRLKIDRQLVMPVVSSAGQRQLVGSIIDIGKSLGIEVLAEGVETMDHAATLDRLGCNALQGYAFARPMSAHDITRFVHARQWRKAS